jgi:hypothetical protein
VKSHFNFSRVLTIGWWGCLTSLVIYGLLIIALRTFFKRNVFSSYLLESNEIIALFFFSSVILSLLIPLILLGMRTIEKSIDVIQVVRIVLIRLAMVEISVIFGVATFFFTYSLIISTIFLLISFIGLILVKKDERLYLETISNLTK